MSDDSDRSDEDKKRSGQASDGSKSSDKGSSDKTDDGGGPSDDDDHDDDKDDGEDKPSLFKRPLFWIILAILVIGGAVGGTLWYLHARQFETTDDAFVDAHIVRIAAQEAGQLVTVADIDNRHVEPGQLLAVVQPNGAVATREEALANVAQARAQASQADANITAAIRTRQQAQAQARSPLANAIKAQQDLARYETLLRLDRNAVALQQLDQARAAARSTAAEAAAAQRQVAEADAQVEVARRAATAARATIGARQAAVQQADVTLGNLRLTAPVAGQVVNRQVNLGSYVAPGAQLMAIVPDTMWVTANFKETQLTLMRIGQPVEIRVDAYPSVKFVGHLDSIQRGAGQAFALLPPQNATGNYVKVVQRVPVRITFDIKNGPDPRKYPIGPGMSVIPTVKVR